MLYHHLTGNKKFDYNYEKKSHHYSISSYDFNFGL